MLTYMTSEADEWNMLTHCGVIQRTRQDVQDYNTVHVLYTYYKSIMGTCINRSCENRVLVCSAGFR